MKKFLAILLTVAMTASIAVAGTMAYLTVDAGVEHNVFTVGNIDVSLDEEVGIYGEGGEVKEDEDGAEYIEVMPGDYLKKEVTVTNNGKTDAYVAVTVTLNNATEINAAIDDVYGDGTEGGQAMYDNIFDGWGVNQDPRPGKFGDDARGVIDGTYGLPEHVLKVDFTKTLNDYWLYGCGNWFHGVDEKANQYWVDSVSVDNFGGGYYAKDMNPNEICYTYYLYLPAGESSTLFNGLNVPADFNADQLKMFDGLKIDIEAAAIQADNMSIADIYAGDENGKAKTAFAILAGDIETPEFSAKPTGSVTSGLTDGDRIWGEATTNAKESLVVKIYSGDTYMGETSLNDYEDIINGSNKTVTWSIKLNGESTEYWTMKWEKAPSLNLMPTSVELWVDGEKLGEGKIKLNNSGDDLYPVTGLKVDANGTIQEFMFGGAQPEAGIYVPFVSSSDELNTKLEAGATTVYLNAGEYDVANGKGKTLALYGTKDAVINPMNEGEDGCDYGFDSSTVTFNGITIDTSKNGGNYKGFGRMTATYNNCVINGAYTTYGNHTFNNCTFDFKNGYLWTWGAESVVFNNCTFNGNSKNILAHGGKSTVITINDCDFAATEKGFTGAGDNTAAVEIDPTGSNTYTINFTGNNTITDIYAGWTRVKDGSTGHTVTGIE